MRKELQQYLNSIENQEKLDFPLESYQVRRILAPIEDIQESDEKAEAYAFNFQANSTGYITELYQGIKYTNQANEEKTFPCRQEVDEVMLEYWNKRAHETNNLILKCRYLNLIVDFSKYGKKRDNAILESIQSNILLIKSMREINVVLLKEYGFHSLRLTLIAKNNKLTQEILDCLVEYAKTFPTVTNMIYSTLYNNKNIRKEHQDSLDELISILETFLNKTLNDEALIAIDIKDLTITLCDYYKNNESENKLRETLLKVEKTYKRLPESDTRAIVKANYLGSLYEIYGRYRKYTFAKNEQARIAKELSDLEKEMQKEMKEYTYKHELTSEEEHVLQDCIEKIYGNTGEDLSLFDVCHRIFLSPLLPRRQHVENIIKKNNQSSSLANFFDQTIIGPYGLIIGILKREDVENRTSYEYANFVKFMEPLYYRTMNELIKRFTSHELAQLLNSSPLFRPEDEVYCQKVANYFWDKDYYGFSALVIPLIESMFRELNRLNNQPIINANANNDGGYDFLSLGTLCDHGMTKHIFGEDFVYFCKTVLLSTFGWNVRNNFCHGINKSCIGDKSVAYRLMYILLSLCMVERLKESQNSDS